MESKKEIIINQEAVKSIEFNFMPREEILGQKPMIAEEKPWMKFIKKLPKEFIRKEIPELEINFDAKFDKLPKQSASLRTFDTDKFLYETFTKQGRTLKHNREHATAWKTYKDYLPTIEDSLKWYRNKKRILKDTLAIVTDSTKKSFHEYEINR